MKKNIIAGFLGATLALTAFTGLALAKEGEVGIVDTQKILESSKLPGALEAAQKELKKLEEDLTKETNNKAKLLDEARMKKVSDAELNKMKDTFTKELENRRNEGVAYSDKKRKEIEDMRNKLKTDVEEAIKTVAKDKKIEVVVDKQAVLFGGVDITEDVIKKIK